MEFKYDPGIHHRRSIRLTDFDYSSDGYYFVTICVKNMKCVFGDVVNGKMDLNEWGKIVQRCWCELPKHYPNCGLDVFMVMPNHMHGIVVIDNVGAGFKPAPTRTQTKRCPLFEIVRGFKTFSARNINNSQSLFHFQWQRNYYEHIVRNETDLNRIREYIKNNPIKWEFDRNNKQNKYPV